MKKKEIIRMKQEYAISSETIMVVPNYDENGVLTSLLGKKNGVTNAGLSPLDLIDTNLRYRGSSMRGAMDGAQAILEKKNMNPLILDREQDIILFPCRSPFRPDCVWLSLRHVKNYKKAGTSHTQVELSNESTITIDVSKQTFDKKMQRAYELRYKMQAQTQQFEGKAMEAGTVYHLFKNVDRLNYEGGQSEEQEFAESL
ncbi:competence protein ComK [Planomicrobium sp. Y74]|uniref:competence protein ComK n=1 Tax=Planomicrobium sp. Y74 TaxID=2478977 RepID=UPI000EF53778|nr:competence protein ComK [Planomicrobium sp. Y74]RLQ86704.1 hypothetical protein D9754_14885 [Planomicrobium sp. Y74]